jgi:hypothetical protein
MGAMTDALAAVETALTTAGVATIIKEWSTVTPPTGQHAVLSCEASALERADVDNFTGTLTVTVDWFYPGAAADTQADYMAAMNAWDAIITTLCTTLDRTCDSVDPGDFQKLEESADLAGYYAATAAVRFMRKEP